MTATPLFERSLKTFAHVFSFYALSKRLRNVHFTDNRNKEQNREVFIDRIYVFVGFFLHARYLFAVCKSMIKRTTLIDVYFIVIDDCFYAIFAVVACAVSLLQSNLKWQHHCLLLIRTFSHYVNKSHKKK